MIPLSRKLRATRNNSRAIHRDRESRTRTDDAIEVRTRMASRPIPTSPACTRAEIQELSRPCMLHHCPLTPIRFNAAPPPNQVDQKSCGRSNAADQAIVRLLSVPLLSSPPRDRKFV